jgi:hypothetical protein
MPPFGQLFYPLGEVKHLVEIGFELATGQALGFLFRLEESPQIDGADGGSGGIETVPHSDLLADLLDHSGGDVEDLGLALDEGRDLILHMQVLAVGAMTVGATTSALAFDKRAGEHLAECPEAADESTTGLEIGMAGHGAMFL